MYFSELTKKFIEYNFTLIGNIYCFNHENAGEVSRFCLRKLPVCCVCGQLHEKMIFDNKF